jgi:ribosome-binding protein aMBF1 (putative translation factor)
MNTVAERIQAACKKRGVSEAQLVQFLRINPHVLLEWKKYHQLINMRRIAAVLEVDLYWLLSGEGTMEITPAKSTEQISGRGGSFTRLRNSSRKKADIKPLLGQRIKHARKSRKQKGKSLSQAELALKLWINHSLVSRWESGTRSVAEYILEPLAKALHVRLKWLLTGEGPMEADEDT